MQKGLAPIVAGSSDMHEFDVLAPTEYKGVTLPFEQIVEVVVGAGGAGVWPFFSAVRDRSLKVKLRFFATWPVPDPPAS
jgi:hypothetical protein